MSMLGGGVRVREQRKIKERHTKGTTEPLMANLEITQYYF